MYRRVATASAYRRDSPSSLCEVVRKYHYDLCRRRARPAAAGSMSCVDRSDNRVHHLLGCLSWRRLICRSEHRMTYLWQRIFSCQSAARGGSGYFLVIGKLRCSDAPHDRNNSRRKGPSINKDNFGAFVAVCQKNFFKYFSRPRSPALIDLLILLLFTHSAFATCEILIPRK